MLNKFKSALFVKLPCGNISHDGDAVAFALAGEDDGPALEIALFDQSPLLKPFEVEMNGGGGFQPHGFADLAHRGGIALLGNDFLKILIDLVCHVGSLWHSNPSGIKCMILYKL